MKHTPDPQLLERPIRILVCTRRSKNRPRYAA